ncbi:hypothetical protein PARPLA_00471 [Rhodobacteraceae bacterium THAF1]|uniref:hypothetical protein n=1 Tax=Palleronia sp. THAF1 TaxID=2587842 RepID=UPI000F41C375|nr:hypothetical protein [Palleronia sp. THAF1]QFU09966.1 hypothetical protein FIU81_14905 [Palleronia sp. THAF1]VDC17129.1 hypothetical protein PARPLA_00471 [Rhodobacteraceae bacterium THAF1]
MIKTLTAAALGLTLALTPIASAPAQALDRDDAAKILGTLAIVGIATGALNNNGRANVTVQRGQARGFRDHRRTRRALPAQCLRSVDTRRGHIRVFGQRCLQRSGVPTRYLPHACATQVRVGGRHRAAYGARCLRHNGWRVAQHR